MNSEKRPGLGFSELERLFKVWEYSRTHRTLLLRSDSDLALKPRPRIELSAGNVQVNFLRSLMTRGLCPPGPRVPARFPEWRRAAMSGQVS